MAVTGISSIWFGVTEWQRARQFYECALGLLPTYVNDEAGWAAYTAKATDPPIFLVMQPSAEVIGPESAGHLRRGGTVGFLVSEADAVMKLVVEYGGTVSNRVQDGTDSWVFTIYDPDFNVIELTEPKPQE